MATTTESVRLQSRSAQSISEAERKQLSRLVSSGAIYNLYKRALKLTSLRHVIYLAKGIRSKRIRGWAIIVQAKGYSREFEFMVFVARLYRRRGIGTRLYKSCKKFLYLADKNIVVYEVDVPGTKFFKSIRPS